jgi:hypothetical protein
MSQVSVGLSMRGMAHWLSRMHTIHGSGAPCAACSWLARRRQALTPRYERMMLEAEVKRQINRESRLSELSG